MLEEPLPGSANPEEETAALYEAAADASVDSLPDTGNVNSQQAHATQPEAPFATGAAANSESAGLWPPAGFDAPADQPAPLSVSTQDTGAAAFVGESADLLRWRAEMLLDEMMVGAVDASAGDQGAFFRQAPPLARAEWIQDEPPPAQPADAQAVYGATAADTSSAHVAASNGSGVNGSGASGAPRRAPKPLPAKGANGVIHAPTQGEGIVGANHAHGALPAADNHADRDADRHADSPAVEPAPPSNGFVLSNGIRGGTGELPPEARNAHTDETNATGTRQNPSPFARDNAAGSTDDAPIPPAPFRPPPSVVARTTQRSGPPHAQTGSTAAQGSGYAGAFPIASTDPYSPEALPPADFASAAPAPTAPAPKAPNRQSARPAPTETDATMPPVASGSTSAYASAYQPASAPPTGESGRKLTAVEQRYPGSANRRENAARAAAPQGASAPRSTGTHADQYNVDDDLPGLGPVRRNPAVINGGTVTGSMAVGPRNARYAALLPRSTPWDTHEMEREILALSEEMARVLPAGHESARRARHLLDKAQTIFAADPQRSAEVDYYLSQVRAIVDRSHQTLQWAGLYRKQLVRYLLAWAVLCSMIVAAALIFGNGLGERISSAMGWAAEGWAASNVAPALLAIYAGALGGAVGGLVNLQRYLAHGVGFIDRKYSLRGLILPIMGMLGGALIFGLLSGLFWMFGISLNSSWLLELVPALLAFGLAFAQESIYGTRE